MMSFLKKMATIAAAGLSLTCVGAEVLDLDVIEYEAFVANDAEALQVLKSALYEKGIVGVRGVPSYREKSQALVEQLRVFHALPEDVKEMYTPDHTVGQSGYERGKERFCRPDGTWVVDDLKVSYYASIPNSEDNQWPLEVDLQTPFEAIGTLMSDTAAEVMKKVGLADVVTIDGVSRCGRMLYYRKNSEGAHDNLYWCGAHFDHGVFTALLPAFYFVDGKQIKEPEEAGLFVRTRGEFKKVIADDPDVMLFQVGEFGQLATNDGIMATEHRVHKANGPVERYTMALFFGAPLEEEICSTSVLANDSRYGAAVSEPCTFGKWHHASLDRYKIK